MDENEALLLQQEWFDRGKEDAWAGRSKQPPDDPNTASFYDLGYSEGEIERPPVSLPTAE